MFLVDWSTATEIQKLVFSGFKNILVTLINFYDILQAFFDSLRSGVPVGLLVTG